MAKQIKTVIYGEGGFDETKPDNNVVSIEYYTNDELAEQSEAEAKAQAKVAAESKLAALGLTTEDLKALGLGGN